MGANGFSSIQNLDELVRAGFSDKQARAILQTVAQDSASKADLEHATTGLKRDIKELDVKIETTKAELKRDIKELELSLKHDTFVKLIYFSLAIISVLGSMMGYMKFFVK